ncbi:DNA helicase-2/ATP-dependent DNA helicase PcrA [Desulfohalotomaculum tongense]|uniref:PD-(D/E)XK nuclease family protein n=1 Tax=Desulforadius tongensis TaxID=1216062 RepID=UPI00195A7AED|nr:UrvD/REP family ATP-dependent DNA helicase [Desulforadius tongensis]MBM7855058.1 DNA helicase-2/ATP-dependent DNA helicase PcrA [Desulforadius tongensis]
MHAEIISPGESIKEQVMKEVSKLLGKGAAAENILILASRRKIVEGIKKEIINLLPNGYGELWVLTGAGFSSKLRYRYPLNLKRDLEFIRGWKQYVLFQEAAGRVELQSVFKSVQGKRSFLLQAMNFANMLELNNISAGDFKKWAQVEGNSKFIDMANIYASFKNLCQKTGNYTPQGLTQLLLNQLENDLQLAKHLAGKFKYIILAGAQDIDVVYLKLIKLLSDNGSNVTAYIDAVDYLANSQGEELWDVLSFFGLGHKEVKKITGAQQGLTAVVSLFFEPSLKAVSAKPETVLVPAEKSVDEVTWLASKIKELLNSGAALEDCAVFYRDLNNHPNLLEILKNNGILYYADIVERWYQDTYLKFIINTLKFILDPADDNRLYQLLTSPVVGIDSYQCRRWIAAAREEGIRLIEYLKSMINDLEVDHRKAVKAVLDLAHRNGQDSAVEAVEQVVKKFKLYLLAAGSEDGRSAVNRIKETITSARYINSLRETCGRKLTVEDFLNVWEQSGFRIIHQEQKEETAAVAVANIRRAESIERKYVFILGAVDGIIPAPRSPQHYFSSSEIKILFNGMGPLKPAGVLTSEQIKKQEEQFFIQALKAAKERVYISFAKEYPGRPEAIPSVYVYRLLNFEDICRENALKHGLGWEEPENKAKAAAGMELPLVNYGKNTAACVLAARCLYKGVEEILRGREYFDNLPEEKVKPEFFIPLPQEPVQFEGAPYVSASGIRDFLNCPRQFFFSKVLRLEEQGNENLTFGSLVHSVLEKFHDKYPFLSSSEDLGKEMERILQGVVNKYEFSHLLVGKDQQRRAKEMVFSYLEREKEYWEDGREVVYREHSIKWQTDNFNLRGFIDRIDKLPDGSYEVIDYKTSKAAAYKTLRKKFMPSGDGEYKPEDLQLPIYYWALKEVMPGINISRLTLYYLKEEPTPRTFQLVGGGSGDKEICPGILNGVVRDKFHEVIEQICQGEFLAQPGNCYHCSYKQFCSDIENQGGNCSE